MKWIVQTTSNRRRFLLKYGSRTNSDSSIGKCKMKGERSWALLGKVRAL